MSQYKHWKLTTDTDHIIWLGFDRADSSVNTLNEDVLNELNSLLQDVCHIRGAQGLVIYSLKAKGFIAGADVHQFGNFESESQIIDFLRKGQAVFARLESLPIPTVAMIHGFCMGGGLELALACRYRLASDSNETKLGLPEVMLGFNPGWGGTVRLPRLIGGFQALTQIMLTGIPISAGRAKQLGVIDDMVPERQLKRAAVYYLKNLPPKHKPSFIQSATHFPVIRRLLAALMRHQVAKKVRIEHYPAPFAMIDLWEKEGGTDERAYLKEIDSVEHLIHHGETAKNLIRLFLLRDRLKSFAKQSKSVVKHVHVIGAGVMGGDIAAWCALKGLKVTLQDTTYKQIAPAIGRASELFAKKLRKPRLIQSAMDRLIPDPEGEGVADADVIIEAVFEKREVKQSIFKLIEEKAKPDAIIATNTSSIPLDEINTVMQSPERLVGIHFFNPVAKMELIEIVCGEKTSREVAQRASSFVNQIGRLPLPVKSTPGFLINRLLMPYLLESMQLLNEGYSPEVIDDAAKWFGMVMGPVELADTVGLDVCLAVAEKLIDVFGGKVPDRLRTMVSQEKLGRKSGQGFYRYVHGKPVKQRVTSHDKREELSQRLIQRIITEAKTCLQEGVVEDADLLDAGMIFATGFAPFRGGPMHYANAMGSKVKPRKAGKQAKDDGISAEHHAKHGNEAIDG